MASNKSSAYVLEAREKAAEGALKLMLMRSPLRIGVPPNHVYVHQRCSEVVLEALEPFCPLKWERLIDVTMGLGAGFSGMGEVCGAVVGYIIASGLDLAARYRDTTVLRILGGRAAQKFMRDFAKEFGSTRCKEIIAPHDLSGYLTPGGEEMEIYEAFMKDTASQMKCWNAMRFAIMYPLPSEEQDLSPVR
ncbi:MAG: C_GCAxxG_C_C family protein [Deltaproteobacteria bacterium]|nr:C_GCAxxG_C_C family protein [Deltaproteobacteria bacterium]